MASLEEVLRAARSLPAAEQQQLARALTAGPVPGRGAELPLASVPATTPRPHSGAWVKAERGHAVLATATGASEAQLPTGAPAIAGMWSDRWEVPADTEAGRNAEQARPPRPSKEGT